MIRYVILVLLGGCSFGILSTFVKLAYGNGLSLADVTSAQAYFGAAFLWLFLLFFQLGKKGSKSERRPRAKTSTALKLVLTGMASGCISISY